MRVGQGFDAHRLVPGRRLVLGGVIIDHPMGLEGHSDADVLTHAVIDAILGAAGLGDIGLHFPETDPVFEGACSIGLLETACRKVAGMGFRIGNIDATIIAQAPRMAPFRTQMADNLAAAAGVPVDRVNVKATTAERMGFTGREEGIAAAAVVLLEEEAP
jgi:2-C-methyl-D-erythritol 2,4-cyclodiphosphate synthase